MRQFRSMKGCWDSHTRLSPAGHVSGSIAFCLTTLKVTGEAGAPRTSEQISAPRVLPRERLVSISSTSAISVRPRQQLLSDRAGSFLAWSRFSAHTEEQRSKCIQRKERNSTASNATQLWNMREAGALANTAFSDQWAKTQTQPLLDAGDASVGIWSTRASSSDWTKLTWSQREEKSWARH